MSDFYDRDGKPLGLLNWAYLYEQRSYRFVAKTSILPGGNDPLRVVSTLWLGHDMEAWTAPPTPKIFETGVLGVRGLLECERSATERQAIQIHDATVRRIAASVTNPMIVHHPIVPAAPPSGWAVSR